MQAQSLTSRPITRSPEQVIPAQANPCRGGHGTPFPQFWKCLYRVYVAFCKSINALVSVKLLPAAAATGAQNATATASAATCRSRATSWCAPADPLLEPPHAAICRGNRAVPYVIFQQNLRRAPLEGGLEPAIVAVSCAALSSKSGERRQAGRQAGTPAFSCRRGGVQGNY